MMEPSSSTIADFRSGAFDHAPSIRARIINDDETTKTLLDMVKLSHGVLVADNKYNMFRGLLTEVVVRTSGLNETLKKVRKEELFQPLHKSEFTSKQKSEESCILDTVLDQFIVELLRFLAMKLLLEKVAKVPEIRPCPTITTDLNIIPSIAIRDAWKALLLLPHLYLDICISLGCEGPMDLDVMDLRFEYDPDNHLVNDVQVRRSREDYRYTLDVYEKVYLSIPREEYCARLTFDCDEDRDSTFFDNFVDVGEWISMRVKECVGGVRDDSVPTDIKFDKVLYDI